jgi:hypothetical protein
MAEDYGLSGAPILIIDLRPVFGRDRWHGTCSFLRLVKVDEIGSLSVSVVVIISGVAVGQVNFIRIVARF